jgi:hypothetical protein
MAAKMYDLAITKNMIVCFILNTPFFFLNNDRMATLPLKHITITFTKSKHPKTNTKSSFFPIFVTELIPRYD